jgi:sugar-specific transcriptional regulator TrmB
MIKELQKLGLGKYESQIYLALLKLGESPAKPIIEETNLHRQIIYDALDKLIAKGFVSYVLQANRKYFKASSPKKFIELFDEQEKELEEKKSEFDKLLPKLEKLNVSSVDEQGATTYKGEKGIRALLDDMIEDSKEEILTIGASQIEAESFQKQLNINLPRFHNFREKQRQSLKILLSEKMKKRAKEIDKQKYTSVKLLSEEFTSNMSTNIYGDKVSIILWGSQPFGILINSKEIAVAQKKYFDLLWKAGKKLN